MWAEICCVAKVYGHYHLPIIAEPALQFQQGGKRTDVPWPVSSAALPALQCLLAVAVALLGQEAQRRRPRSLCKPG